MTERKLKEYLKGHKQIKIHGEFPWNCRIESVSLGEKSKVLFQIYWQGDSTDGYRYVPFVLLKQVSENTPYTIPAEHFFDGERTRARHSDLRITKEMVDEAFKIIEDVLGK